MIFTPKEDAFRREKRKYQESPSTRLKKSMKRKREKSTTKQREAFRKIQKLMDRKEWNADTLDGIADIMRAAGYPIRDPK